MKFILLFLILLFSLGCSDLAAVKMADGKIYEGKIHHMDNNALYLGSTREFSDGELTSLVRNDIVKIDHPGNVMLLIGGIISGIGSIYAGLGLLVRTSPDQYNQEVFGTILLFEGAMLLAVGLPMAIWGWITWDESTSKVTESAFIEGPRILISPTLLDHENVKPGLSFRLRF